MDQFFQDSILQSTGATALGESEEIQELWDGYGSIVRYGLKGAPMESVIVKHVRLPRYGRRTRGTEGDRSHRRKVRSYRVEMAWYEAWSSFCHDACRVPSCLALQSKGDEVLMVLEDLDAAGFPLRKRAVRWDEMKACLSWLAHFHATFMGKKPEGLWSIGTYWHLDTRPDELKFLDDHALKKAARAIDQKLQQARFRTLVHGDAKLANFCFSVDGTQVAAVDFQYVGGGCGMKDLAYFTGSCLDDAECESWEADVLDVYFTFLRDALHNAHTTLDVDALEDEWRALYPFAWTDFHRFLKGWSPGRWSSSSYSERLAREVIAGL